ncbi:MAG: flagellar basal body M-ring protein FliF [Gammaproteobacteria bacterium]|nr:MAG: flagellar basal body M-ring protein FliF [Gammaproteobacteria bacterium]
MNMPDTSAMNLGFLRLPVVRQLGLLMGLAVSVALGVGAVLWSQEPSYRPLFTGLADKDSAQIVDALQKVNTPYKVEAATGAILVPADRIYDLRLKLAGQGLPKGTAGGFEIMQEQQGFGTSQFLEVARYQYALEGELARTITALANVQSARVHLALPKQSAFIRARQEPTASVLVNLYAGRTLEQSQVAAIVHLVASSIPNLSAQRVTVIDQQGRLLTGAQQAQENGLSASQLEYTQRLEDSYAKRIEEILLPVMGAGKVKAQVAVEVDFTVTEQTQEDYNNEKPLVRSEQVREEKTVSGANATGVPGALSNQPPAEATLVQNSLASGEGSANASTENKAEAAPLNSSNHTTRNYELNRVISHTRLASGMVRRISAAVVLDNKVVVNDDGEATPMPLKPEELERITGLVKEAVGFNEKRGDTVNVLNIAFTPPEEAEPLPDTPFFDKPWVAAAGKSLLAAAVVLVLVIGVLRPVLSALATRGANAGADGGLSLRDDRVSLGAGAAPRLAAAAGDYEGNLSTVKSLAAQDPKRVAQVVKTWVAKDA